MGKIVSIKRFEIHDGPGIRTTVFFKGCPLKCIWCHNPECIEERQQISIDWNKCINCGNCSRVCANHQMIDGIHHFDYQNCQGCQKCLDACPNEAISFYGQEISAERLVDILLEDQEFFLSSDGGVTISGGEPFLQPRFLKEVVLLLKEKGINVAIDTSGLANRETIKEIMNDVDIFLYDLKAFSEEKHLECTGVSNRIIKENLEFLLENKKKIEIRIPVIPSINDDEVKKIADYLASLEFKGIVKLLPFHNLARTKYHNIGRTYNLEEMKNMNSKDLNKYIDYFKEKGLNARNGGSND